MKQVTASMCTSMCCSTMNMSMYMHGMCRTQGPVLKVNQINQAINRKLLYQHEPVNIQNNNPLVFFISVSVAR